MKHTLIPLLAAIYLTACSTITPAPTAAALPSPTMALTQTPVLTPTAALETTVTAGSEAGISYEAPAGGWGAVIAEGLADPNLVHSEPWVDKDGTQHFEFQSGENVPDEQKIKELKKFCPPIGCISTGSSATGSFLAIYDRGTGDMELNIRKDGEMELLYSVDIWNTLMKYTDEDLKAPVDPRLQRIKIRRLLPDWSETTKYYYKNFGLNSKSKFDLKTILELFGEGRLSDPTYLMKPAPNWLDYPFSRTYKYMYSEDYFEQVQKWFSNDLDPKQDMELIGL